MTSKQHADPVDRIAAICDDAEGDKLTRIDAVIRGAVETPALPHCPSCKCVEWTKIELGGGAKMYTAPLPPDEPTPRRECVHVWEVSLYRSDTEVCENCGKWRDRAAENGDASLKEKQ